VGSLCWTHVRFFTEASLTAMLHEAGFTVEQVAAEHAPADAAISLATLDVLQSFGVDWALQGLQFLDAIQRSAHSQQWEPVGAALEVVA
jgi:hypothetical protein